MGPLHFFVVGRQLIPVGLLTAPVYSVHGFGVLSLRLLHACEKARGSPVLAGFGFLEVISLPTERKMYRRVKGYHHPP